jgi:hypothetical protein
VFLQPAVSRRDFALEDLPQKSVEGWRVIKVDKMRDLVSDNRTAHEIRGLHQTPVDADAAFVRT